MMTTNTVWDYFMTWGLGGLALCMFLNVIPFAIDMEKRIKSKYKLALFYFVIALIIGPFAWIMVILVLLIAVVWYFFIAPIFKFFGNTWDKIELWLTS